MASLSLRGIRKTLGKTPILRGIDLDVNDGELAVLVGPSGCGKSTLLRTIAGLEEPDEGTVLIGSRDVTHTPPRDRNVAMVFQSYALYPHLTVRDNLAFGLKLRGESPETIRARIEEVSRMLGLEHLLERYPRQLSGGQRQRVAMGRAIARRPSLFLFDEPLSNLDAALRGQVRVEIKKLHATLRTTMLYVTHDQVEAMTLADRLVVLNNGRIEQQGPPLQVYQQPATRFVAAFLGSPSMNFIEGQVHHDNTTIVGPGMHIPIDPARSKLLSPGQRITVGIRPHDVSVVPNAPYSHDPHAPDSHSPLANLQLQIEVIETLGFEAYAHGTVGNTPFIARLDGSLSSLPRPHDRIQLTVNPQSVHLFDPDTGHALSAHPFTTEHDNVR